ncbi:MAG: hypothetical protein KI792_09800 [Alphaproteobacteria bacterium]|nr:hypothetical protein [Alphaproteobacteria bacterium SS10]
MASATIIDLAAHRRLQATDCPPFGGNQNGSLTSRNHHMARRWSADLNRSLHNPHDFMAATRHGYAIDGDETIAAAIHKLAMGDEGAGRIAADLATNLHAITGVDDLHAVPYLRLLQDRVTANRLWYLHDQVCGGDLIALTAWLDAVFWCVIDEVDLELASRIGSDWTPDIISTIRELNPCFGQVSADSLVRQALPARLPG